MAVRVVFLGNAPWSVPALEALSEDPGVEVALVLTRTPRPGRRGAGPRPTPVAVAARHRDLELAEVETVRAGEGLTRLRDAAADVLAVVAYGELLPPEVLNTAPLGAVNLHLSLLPRWRGASPVQHALLAGDLESGVTVMRIDEGLDTGPVLAREMTPIREGEHAGSLGDRLARIGALVLVRAVVDLAAGNARPAPQAEEGVTVAPKLTAEDRRIRWEEPTGRVLGRIRAFAPVPGADTRRAGRGLKILAAARADGTGPPGSVLAVGPGSFEVATGDAALQIEEVASEGRARMDAASWLRGAHLQPGERLG